MRGRRTDPDLDEIEARIQRHLTACRRLWWRLINLGIKKDRAVIYGDDDAVKAIERTQFIVEQDLDLAQAYLATALRAEARARAPASWRDASWAR